MALKLTFVFLVQTYTFYVSIVYFLSVSIFFLVFHLDLNVMIFVDFLQLIKIHAFV